MAVDLEDMEDAPEPVPVPTTVEGPPKGLSYQVPGAVEYVNLLLYGGSGSGKTHMLATAAEIDEMCPIIYLDTESGQTTLKKLKIQEDRMKVITINSFHDFSPIGDWLARGKHGFKTVVLDSLTEMHAQSMEIILHEAAKANPNQDPDIASQREWGKVGEQIKRFVRFMRDLEMHTLIAALDKQDKDDKGKMYTMIDMPGQLARKVPGYMDEVFYLYTKINTKGDGTKRYLLTQKTEKEVAKDRFGGFPLVIEEPNMRIVYDTIFKP